MVDALIGFIRATPSRTRHPGESWDLPVPGRSARQLGYPSFRWVTDMVWVSDYRVAAFPIIEVEACRHSG
jgi:hypothetical protein